MFSFRVQRVPKGLSCTPYLLSRKRTAKGTAGAEAVVAFLRRHYSGAMSSSAAALGMEAVSEMMPIFT